MLVETWTLCSDVAKEGETCGKEVDWLRSIGGSEIAPNSEEGVKLTRG
jgi:hypothetical protein